MPINASSGSERNVMAAARGGLKRLSQTLAHSEERRERQDSEALETPALVVDDALLRPGGALGVEIGEKKGLVAVVFGRVGPLVAIDIRLLRAMARIGEDDGVARRRLLQNIVPGASYRIARRRLIQKDHRVHAPRLHRLRGSRPCPSPVKNPLDGQRPAGELPDPGFR